MDRILKEKMIMMTRRKGTPVKKRKVKKLNFKLTQC